MKRRRAVKTAPGLADKIRHQMRTMARAKKLYERADTLLAEIAQEMKPGDEVPLTEDGKKAVLIDNFSGKSIVWGHGGVRHFAIEIVDA
jgi:hypothetical protein